MNEVELRRRIEADPLDYDAYVELLPLVKEKSPVCQRFHEHFPLDERTWLAWLEESGASSPQLFALALEDYLSPALHVANLQRQWPALSPADMRAQYEAAAKAVGSHFTRGHLFWDSWIQYELQLTGGGGKVAEVMGSKATSALEHVEQYWREFAAQFPDLASQQRPRFDLALATVSRQQVQENVLRECRESNDECAGSPTTAANARLEKEWLNHLWVEVQQHLADSDAKRVLFERAVADCCLSERIWHMYLRFLEPSHEHVVFPTALRAVRNLPSSATCWAVRIRSSPPAAVEDDGLWASVVRSVDQADLLEPASMWVKRHPGQLDAVADTLRHVDVVVELLLLDLPGANRRRNWDRIHVLRPTDESLWQAHIAEEAASKASEGRLRELYTQALGAVKTHLRGIEVLGRAWVRFEFAHMSSSAAAYNKAVDTVAKRKRDCSRGVAAVATPQLVPKNLQPEAKRAKTETEETEESGQSHEVFIGALPRGATKETLRAFFSNHVQVEGSFVHMVHVGTRRDGTRYAHVTFGGTSPQAAVRAARAACGLSGTEFEGEPVAILLSHPPKPKPKPKSQPRSKPKPEPESVGASMEVETASMAGARAPPRRPAMLLPRSVAAKSLATAPSTKPA